MTPLSELDLTTLEQSCDHDICLAAGAVAEIRHLREQVTRLQTKDTALVEENRVLRASKLCVTALLTDGSRVALIRSSKQGRAWELPGGKVNPGEDWRAAMSREAAEETGLVVLAAAWTVVDVLSGLPVPGAMFASTIIVAQADAIGEPAAGDDAAEARWFHRHDLPLNLSALQSRHALLAWASR